MDVTRFRSFVERYVIERASTFRVDHEEEDMWNAILNAKACYKKIAQHGLAEKDYDDMGTGKPEATSGVGQSTLSHAIAYPPTGQYAGQRVKAAVGQAFVSHKPGTP